MIITQARLLDPKGEPNMAINKNTTVKMHQSAKQ